MHRLTYDFSGTTNERIGPQAGVAPEALAVALRRLDDQLESIRARDLSRGYIRLPDETDVAEGVNSFAATAAQSASTVVVLGIGGSSLGPRAVIEAMAMPGQPGRLWGGRSGLPVVFLDNVDPEGLHSWLSTIDLKTTLFLVISKSGSTVETAAQLLVVEQMLRAQVGDSWKTHVVAITDPERGPLREIANHHSLRSFGIPSDVGGRFSVLTPVGLLPAALAGINVNRLLEGAAQAKRALLNQPAAQNPAAMSAAIHYLYHKAGRPIRVIMPYRQSLVALADWFLQLWGESLGKDLQSGSTPVRAVGVTDQHSQLQLYKDGPADKVINFWRVENSRAEVMIPQSNLSEAFSYLQGKTLTELLRAEYLGTRTALIEAQRPVIEVTMAQLDELQIGAMLFEMELETELAAVLYDVNAFDQPGVELGKQFAFGLLRRRGYEDFRERFEARQGLLPQYVASVPLTPGH